MAIEEFRGLALGLPEAVEQDHFGAPSFRVRGKIFAQLSADETKALVKLPLEIQGSVVASHPEACFVEPHWGRFGWTRLAWAALPFALVADLLRMSWRAVAPRSLRDAAS